MAFEQMLAAAYSSRFRCHLKKSKPQMISVTGPEVGSIERGNTIVPDVDC